MMRRLAILASLSLSVGMIACGSDNNGGTPDSPINTPDSPVSTIDARLPDAPGPDAGTPVSGTIALHDVQLLDSTGHIDTALGHGGQATITFAPSATPVLRVSHPHSAGLAPCNASYFVAANVPADRDEGTVAFTVKHTGGAAGTPIPPCTFNATTGSYMCLSPIQDNAFMGNGGTIAAAANNANLGFLTFTDSLNSRTFSTDEVGRYLILAGGGANAGAAFPIMGVGTAGTAKELSLFNLPQIDVSGGPFTLTGPYIIAAGIGPVPATANVDGSSPGAPPAFLNDGDTVAISLTPGGSHDVAAYMTGAATPIGAGGHFVLDAATTTLLATDVNTAGTLGGMGSNAKVDISGTNDVTFGIDMANSGTAPGLIVIIDATDATSFTGPTDMGTPHMFTGSLTCSQISVSSLTIEKDIMGVLGAMHPTKLRISIFRDGFDISRSDINAVAGHGLVTYQTR